MLSETGSIIFYGQKFGGIALPEGRDISEETRLRAAAIGEYEVWFRQQPQYEFSGAFLLNDEKPDTQRPEQQKQFEVFEDIAEVERTLMIQSAPAGITLESLEIIPLDWRENPIEFTPLEVNESLRKISYRKEPPVESLKLKFSGVNVFDVEVINAVLWSQVRDYSPGPLPAFIRRWEDIRIDRLDYSRNGARRIEEHLLTFFQLLLENAPNRTFDFECSYRYPVVEDGPNALIPVMQSLNLATASDLFSGLQPKLNAWYRSFSPPEGVFDFGVKVYGGGSRRAVPVLHLTGIVLPIESIAEWADPRANSTSNRVNIA